jgi:hypothetical protein
MEHPTKNWKVDKELFEAALEEEAARRSLLLRERCPDADVCAAVERLLAEHEQAGGFLSTPVLGESTPDQAFGAPKRKIDSYYPIGLIGEGGMGEVWLAEQSSRCAGVSLSSSSRPEWTRARW